MSRRPLCIPLRFLIAVGLVLLNWAPARADMTSVSDTPLIVATPSSVQPNLMFVLDDSDSMNFDYVPDVVNSNVCRSAGATSSTATGTFTGSCCPGFSSYACWAAVPSSAAPFKGRGHPPFLAAGFNGLAYNADIRYVPTVGYTGASAGNVTNFASVRNDYYGTQSTTSINLLTQYPDLEWCTDTNYTDCMRNGNYVLPGKVNAKSYTVAHATVATGSGQMAMGAPENAGSTAQAWGPHYYKIVASEYCDAVDLRHCQVGQGGSFVYPAPVRWCNSAANATALTPAANACQALSTDIFTVPRYPTKYPSAVSGGSAYIPGTPAVPADPGTPATATYGVTLTSCTGAKTATVTQLNINGINVLSKATAAATNATTLAADIAAKLTRGGYSATASGAHFTVTAPVSAGTLSGALSTPTYSAVSPCKFALTGGAYRGYVAPTAAVPAVPPVNAVAGLPAARFERVDIVPGRTSYPKASTRTDCAGSTCTYNEEMTNFANWWTYYHSRMQMMKTSAMLAFNGLPTNYRVGYMTINNAQGNAFMNPATFGASSAARQSWWTKLAGAQLAYNTPLRTAAATIGRYYAGKYNGSSINGVAAVDPMQYACQKNVMLLSTDGFWNDTVNPTQLDGATAIGDQDSSLPRPMNDGLHIPNTLADITAYYYNTDLRTGATGSAACKSGNTDDANKYLGNDVCGNSSKDPVQRLSTFTLGLGASGYMQFKPDYASATTGDYYAVSQGLSPTATTCSWQTGGACTWPNIVSNTLTTVDDLWHAAVNGHGTYFSAGDPASLYLGLSSALSAIDISLGASAAVGTSSPFVSPSNNQAFVSSFTSGEWTGEVQGRRINTSGPDIGALSGTVDWSAAALIDAMSWPVSTAANARRIYTFNSAASNHRRDFDWSTLTSTEQGYFSLSVMVSAGLQQFCTTGAGCLSAADQASAAGKPVVDFLRGDRSNEGTALTTNKYFRQRSHLLGDIAGSEAVTVSAPTTHFNDAGYSAFKTSAIVTSRPDTVYVGANDGMLHAFNASTGQEMWAYVPTVLLPKLYKLVDKGYANKHSFFVDGSPVVRDFYDGSKWRTLLVGSLAAGGRAYFGIDVTDPSNPLPLWEFTDSNLGLTFGKAEVAKLTGGKWVVMLPSGYNNVSPGDGVGRLFVIDPLTGAQVAGFAGGISTGAGSTATPSGLGHIRAWSDNSDIDNTALRVYGGDGLGYLWRFDINNNVGTPGIDAQLLATLKAPNGVAQPITSRPELGLVGNSAMVFVGTGRYMGLADIGDATQQTIYGIKDRLTSANYGDPRAAANAFVKQTLTTGSCPTGLGACTAGSVVRVNGTPKPVNLNVNGGWYVDLPTTYERASTDGQLIAGVLIINTNVVDNNKVCSVGGSSWQNYFDYASGAAPATAQNVTSVFLGDTIATRPNAVVINGKVQLQTTESDGGRDTRTPPLTAPAQQTRRISYRELPRL